MKKCLWCGNALKGKQEKFCSSACIKKNWKKNNREKVNEWQREYFKRKARENWEKIECVVCGKMFLPKLTHKGQQKYCSKKCVNFLVKRVSRQNYRAEYIYGDKGKITVKDWLEILERDCWKCQLCGNSENIEMDHITPLSAGGKHAKENIRVSCSKCNRKNDTSFKSSIAP
jgi:5-methylcytosine-specific restriction endonuclease McrA